MDQTARILNQTLPILLLIGLGAWIRRKRFVAESSMEDVKKLVVNAALPAALFLSFLEIRFEAVYLPLIVLVFVLCLGLYGFGLATRKVLGRGRAYYPFLTTGFEYGMLGVSLFGGAYGLERIGYIAVTDLGHELFIWFVFLSLLLARRDGAQSPARLLGVFLRSPVILAIVAGVGMNLLFAGAPPREALVLGAVLAALKFLAGMTIPLILLIVGHGIRFEEEGFGEAVRLAVLRLVLLIPLALSLNVFFIRGLLGLGKPFEAALFTLLILPPPFIIPLYMRPGDDRERRYVLNVLTVNTVLSLAVFSVYLAFNPAL